MSERSKKIFLAICIIVPFILYSYYYYSSMVRNAPFRFTDFESIVLKYGEGEDLPNQFDTRTGIFQYKNQRDSLVYDTLRLRNDDLLYLHRKAAELGLWNLPDDMTVAPDSTRANDIPRFYLEYNYKEKSKIITLDADFVGPEKMTGTARSVIDEVRRVISDVRDRS